MPSDNADDRPVSDAAGPTIAESSTPAGGNAAQTNLVFEGTSVCARIGESLASALAGAGHLVMRKTARGSERGVFCGMGVCRDCLVDIGERRNVRACMTRVEPGMAVRRAGGGSPPHEPANASTFRQLDTLTVDHPDVFVIGAGPAGLSAALSARRAGARVVLADERAKPGGQYFKQSSTGSPVDRQQDEGRRLIERALDEGVEIWSDTLVWGGFEPLDFAINRAGGTMVVRPRAAVYAGGAYEKPWPVPGWVLPGVMTTGAAQTMWRSDRRLAGKRILIAGNGPLNLQLASELLAGGAEVVAIVEAAPSPRSFLNAARMVLSAPGLVMQGLRYLANCRRAGVPLLYGSQVGAIVQTTAGLEVHVAGVNERSLAADIVCLGYGFLPSNELLRAMGARCRYDSGAGHSVVERTAECETSITGLFAIGDCTGLNGARVALAEGTLAGAAAAQRAGFGSPARETLRNASASLRRHRRFQKALWSVYQPLMNSAPAADDTIVCRCEEVSRGDILSALEEGYHTAASIKQRTRLGMGHCQGRYCGTILSALLEQNGHEVDDHSGFAPRFPVKPVPIGSLALDPAEL
ncbi:MAG: FAD-dependent oxidoreductase [Rhizobiaceae bacterium]|nr:FAD-dependent oxidoreductase [Rhizobiaceae bacterium]